MAASAMTMEMKTPLECRSRRDGQQVGQRNLQEPEAEEIDDGWRDGVSRAVEGLQHDHAVGVARCCRS